MQHAAKRARQCCGSASVQIAQFAVILFQCGRRSSQQKLDIDLRFGSEVKGAGSEADALASPGLKLPCEEAPHGGMQGFSGAPLEEQ